MTDRTMVAQIPGKACKLLQASSYDRRAVEKDKEGCYANDGWSHYLR